MTIEANPGDYIRDKNGEVWILVDTYPAGVTVGSETDAIAARVVRPGWSKVEKLWLSFFTEKVRDADEASLQTVYPRPTTSRLNLLRTPMDEPAFVEPDQHVYLERAVEWWRDMYSRCARQRSMMITEKWATRALIAEFFEAEQAMNLEMAEYEQSVDPWPEHKPARDRYRQARDALQGLTG